MQKYDKFFAVRGFFYFARHLESAFGQDPESLKNA
jgi:hypothetical protein